tara:strand:- start:3306 stop:4457 length:1152 start_codon:yes stop_codon:yes gene_type:complete
MARASLFSIIILTAAIAVYISTTLLKTSEFQELIAHGDRAIQDYDASLAIEHYSGALALNGQSMVAYLKRGAAYKIRGDLNAALRDTTIAVQLDPTATQPHEQLGDVTLELQKFDEADRHYTRYLNIDQENPFLLYKLGLARERSGNVATAIPVIRKALEIKPDFYQARYLLGLCLVEQARFSEASHILRTVTTEQPGFLPAREALANIYFSLGNSRLELQEHDALVALDQKNPNRHIGRARAYARADQLDFGLLTLQRALEANPDSPILIETLAEFYVRFAEIRDDHTALSDALISFNMIDLSTASSRALAYFGKTLLLAGDSTTARHILGLAISRSPVEPEAFLILSLVEEELLNWSEARKSRQKYEILTNSIIASPANNN